MPFLIPIKAIRAGGFSIKLFRAEVVATGGFEGVGEQIAIEVSVAVVVEKCGLRTVSRIVQTVFCCPFGEGWHRTG